MGGRPKLKGVIKYNWVVDFSYSLSCLYYAAYRFIGIKVRRESIS